MQTLAFWQTELIYDLWSALTIWIKLTLRFFAMFFASNFASRLFLSNLIAITENCIINGFCNSNRHNTQYRRDIFYFSQELNTDCLNSTEFVLILKQWY